MPEMVRNPGSTRRWLRSAIPAALSSAVLAAGCVKGADDRGSPADEPLLVMAAASLSDAMPVLIDRFERESGVRVDLALGATRNLAAQIENGAPADLFFAADEATVRRLAARGSIRPSSLRTYAFGELVLVWAHAALPPLGPQALAKSRYEVIAIANSAAAPYGAAAQQVLEQLGLEAALERRVVQAENVAQAYQMVRTGNADAALVARSLVETGSTEFIVVDPRLHSPLRQAAGILEGSVHPAAEPFLLYVLSDEGQAILADHGFRTAPR